MDGGGRPGAQPPPDVPAALVRAAQGGDLLAMNDLLGLLDPYVRRICGPIALRDGADAAQEALLAVFQRLGQLRDPAALYGWVRTTAVREAVRVSRRAARERPVDDVAAVAGPAAGRRPPVLGADPTAELATDVRDVLGRLSPEHRAILVLRELEGLDERSASALLRISPGTAKSRLHRARHRFREAWTR